MNNKFIIDALLTYEKLTVNYVKGDFKKSQG